MPYKMTAIIVDLVLFFWQRIPGLVIHNLSKARMLKIIFWHLNVDQMNGDYLEFGVAHGHSMRAAAIAERNSFSRKIGVPHVKRNLYGFDTFDQFESTSELDSHGTWKGDKFSASLDKVQRRFKHNKNVTLVQVDANTLTTKEGNVSKEIYGLNQGAAVILLDMDLYAPTLAALIWCRELLQQGTFIVLDEYYSFKGREDLGEARAVNEFLHLYPEVILRDFCTYGAGGKVFIVNLSQ